MQNNTNKNYTQKYLKDLELKLNQKLKNGKTDLFASYFDVALAFPGGPHPKSFDYNAIDFKALKLWADQNNWHVETAPEITHKDQQDTPNVRFTKIP